MQLSDIELGHIIILEIHINNKILPLKLSVSKINSDNTILTDTFTFNNTKINLNKSFKDATYNIIITKDDSRYEWSNVNVVDTVIHDKNYYKISTPGFNSEAHKADRRENERIKVEIDYKCLLHAIDLMSDYNVDLYDISNNGLSFLSDKEIDILNNAIEVCINDLIGTDELQINLACTCVKITKIGDKYRYGCRINSSSEQYKKYVYNKKLEVIKKYGVKNRSSVNIRKLINRNTSISNSNGYRYRRDK